MKVWKSNFCGPMHTFQGIPGQLKLNAEVSIRSGFVYTWYNLLDLCQFDVFALVKIFLKKILHIPELTSKI